MANFISKKSKGKPMKEKKMLITIKGDVPDEGIELITKTIDFYLKTLQTGKYPFTHEIISVESPPQTLKEVLQKYPTIKDVYCSDCGNPWWFDKGNSFVCTTCRKTRGKHPATPLQERLQDGFQPSPEYEIYFQAWRAYYKAASESEIIHRINSRDGSTRTEDLYLDSPSYIRAEVMREGDLAMQDVLSRAGRISRPDPTDPEWVRAKQDALREGKK